MLDVMLGNGQSAFSCGEVYAWFRPWRTHHRKIRCACGSDPCPVWEKIAYVPEARFHRTVCDRLNVDFVIDSSKYMPWLIDTQSWAEKSGISVFNVLIYKPPIELAYSQFKRGRDPLGWRDDFVKYHGRLLRLGFPFSAVSYRELVRSPAKILGDICSRIGMHYVSGQEMAARVQSHHVFGSFGVRQQLDGGELRIRAEPEFSDDFERVRETIQARIDRDSEVCDIVDELERRSVGRRPGERTSTQFRRPLVMPAWYHVSRLKGAVRRVFPQDFAAPESSTEWERRS
ncbi:hypothetical protein [Arhodomonas aquaeolei]|uniref:hypothetical protein n=1 Tax=Arhodomonas aquaeolei TaxID=2369 RepID=UPI0012EBB1CA|nr:hypothetical protein [Arhodomonas aquaeolei]